MYRGTISTRPPMLMTTAIKAPIRATFFSTISWLMGLVRSSRSEDGNVARLRITHRAPHVVGHDQHAGEEHQSAEQTNAVVRVRVLERLDERVGQRAVRVQRAPHQT